MSGGGGVRGLASGCSMTASTDGTSGPVFLICNCRHPEHEQQNVQYLLHPINVVF